MKNTKTKIWFLAILVTMMVTGGAASYAAKSGVYFKGEEKLEASAAASAQFLKTSVLGGDEDLSAPKNFAKTKTLNERRVRKAAKKLGVKIEKTPAKSAPAKKIATAPSTSKTTPAKKSAPAAPAKKNTPPKKEIAAGKPIHVAKPFRPLSNPVSAPCAENRIPVIKNGAVTLCAKK